MWIYAAISCHPWYPKPTLLNPCKRRSGFSPRMRNFFFLFPTINLLLGGQETTVLASTRNFPCSGEGQRLRGQAEAEGTSMCSAPLPLWCIQHHSWFLFSMGFLAVWPSGLSESGIFNLLRIHLLWRSGEIERIPKKQWKELDLESGARNGTKTRF